MILNSKQDANSESLSSPPSLRNSHVPNVSLDSFGKGFNRDAGETDIGAEEHDPSIPYQLGNLLGRGAVSLVYEAHDQSNHGVAIKILRRDYRSLPNVDQLLLDKTWIFKEESQFKNVAKVCDWGISSIFGPHLVMQKIHGKTLKQRLAEKRDDFPTLVSFVEAATRELVCLHRRGVFHLDLKPSKIMIEDRMNADGTHNVYLIGLNQTFIKTAVFASLRSKALSFLPYSRVDIDDLIYMSPEQARNDQRDERTDVFGIGGVLCWLLTGLPPCVGNNEYQIGTGRYREDLVSRLNQIGTYPSLTGLTKRCLAFDPKDRPQTAQILADELSAWVNIERLSMVAETETAVRDIVLAKPFLFAQSEA